MMLHLRIHPLSSASSHPLGVQFRSDRVSAFARPRSHDRIRVSGNVHRCGFVPAMAMSSSPSSPCHHEGNNNNKSSNIGAKIAVLDMGDYFSDAREDFVDNLRDQCHRVGLFYVKNHGVSQALCDEMLATARHFFDLPASVKVLFFRAPATELALTILEFILFCKLCVSLEIFSSNSRDEASQS